MLIPGDGNSDQPNDQGFANHLDPFAPSKSVMVHESALKRWLVFYSERAGRSASDPGIATRIIPIGVRRCFLWPGARFRSRHIDAGFLRTAARAFCHLEFDQVPRFAPSIAPPRPQTSAIRHELRAPSIHRPDPSPLLPTPRSWLALSDTDTSSAHPSPEIEHDRSHSLVYDYCAAQYDAF